MHNDAQDTVNRLCTLAGMIMEDSVEAALVGETEGLQERAAGLASAGDDIAALGRAAIVIASRYLAGA